MSKYIIESSNEEVDGLICADLSRYPAWMLRKAADMHDDNAACEGGGDDSAAFILKERYDRKERLVLERSEELGSFWVEDESRFSLFPLKPICAPLWDEYKDNQLRSFWTAGDITFKSDDFNSLPIPVQKITKQFMGVLGVADGMVEENLSNNIMPKIKDPQAMSGYAFQAAMENIHAEVYGLTIAKYIPDPDERHTLFNGITMMRGVKLLADWILKYMKGSLGLAQNMVAFAIVENQMFPMIFAWIFWLKSKKYPLEGLYASNILISKDEWAHARFTGIMYQHYLPQEAKLPHDVVRQMIVDAADVQKAFVEEIFEGGALRFDGMNKDLMFEYIESVADITATLLEPSHAGLPALYGTPNPFPFMENISLDEHTDFFAKRVTQYQRPSGEGDQSDLVLLSDTEEY